MSADDVHSALYRLRKAGHIVASGPKGKSTFALPSPGQEAAQ